MSEESTATRVWEEMLGDGALLVRLGQLCFVWQAGSSVIKVVRMGADDQPDIGSAGGGVFEVEVPPELKPERHDHRHDHTAFLAFCQEFVGSPGGSDSQVLHTHDAIRQALATIRRLSDKTGDGDNKIDWAVAVACAGVAALEADKADPMSRELGTFVNAVGALLGIHSGEQMTDAQMFDRAARHPKARAEFWLTGEELGRVNSGEEVEVGPFIVKAFPLPPEDGETPGELGSQS